MNMKKLGVALLAGGLLAAGVAVGGADEGENGRPARSKGAPDVAPATNPLYQAECGTCHFPYPPCLLPARSWDRLMGNLSDHFCESAELAPETLKTLTDYLVANAGDRVRTRRSLKLTRSIPPGEAPLRITEVPYFVQKHEEVPARLIRDNPKVGSLSNCAACHTRADTGSFSEREIDIPEYGPWKD